MFKKKRKLQPLKYGQYFSHKQNFRTSVCLYIILAICYFRGMSGEIIFTLVSFLES